MPVAQLHIVFALFETHHIGGTLDKTKKSIKYCTMLGYHQSQMPNMISNKSVCAWRSMRVWNDSGVNQSFTKSFTFNIDV